MKYFIRHIIISFVVLVSTVSFGQENALRTKETLIIIKGNVREADSFSPIYGVDIQVNGGSYTQTDRAGDFRVQARIGDELIISHKEFETVYYTIESSERITVEVRPAREKKESKYLSKKRSIQLFRSLIDSAKTYLKKDAKKSIQFITDALLESSSSKENGEAYEVLGDVQMHWKQYDLAVSNYKISLQNYNNPNVNLKLGKAYLLNGETQNSLNTYNGISIKGLSNYQQIELYEGKGDAQKQNNNFQQAIEEYQKGLDLAQKYLVKPKEVDLNSKIAEAYGDGGQIEEAESYYDNSLNLASQENKTRSIKEKVKVADFQNKTEAYSDEIQLRKEVLEDIGAIEVDSIIDNESDITPQKQNYKIGNAYFLQRNYSEAIPYLEKSIEEADSREDLIVKKDATRKLSELFRNSGDYEKALKAYEDYTNLVEELNIKREQEISQSSRLSRDINEKQNRINSLESDRALSKSMYDYTNERNKRQELIIYSLVGGLLLLLIAGYFMYKSMRQQKLANNLLALKTLRSQMNPHFIFNALNSVNSFIASSDERTANKYLTDFSQLMRSVLENSEEDFIPLKKEIDLLEIYTKLEHFRFKDKFDYTITVDEAINTEEFQIPPMLLQPYIENAVWHGLRYKEEKGKLDISIHKISNEEITITIADDGIGRKRSKALKTDNQKKQNSKGMGNIKKRVSILNDMYKDKVDVFIDDYQNEADSGTKVIVTLKKD